jgi:hypothetical protein
MNFLVDLFKKAEEIENEEDSDIDIVPPSEPEIVFPKDYILPKQEETKDNIEIRGLDNGEDFIRSIMGDFTFKIEMINNNKKEKYEMISSNFKSNITHPGFIYYLGYCWAKEKGIVLRADLIWGCVLYEFSKHIIETKDKYIDDFKNLYIVEKNGYDGYMNSYNLVDKFRSYIKYEEFYDMITKERFESEPKNFTEVKIMTFCNFSRIEFKKYKMNCKIPKFQIKGDKKDWLKLLNLIDLLIHLIGNRFFINYLENIKSLISNLIANTFQVMLSEPRLRYQGIKEMIKDIFYVEKGIVKGWGRELYFDCYMNPSRNWELDNFNTHISYIPYVNLKKREACVKAGGLCYSTSERGYLEPMYGSVLFKCNDISVYKKLA